MPDTAIQKVGGGVSASRLTYGPDPEYSERARKVGYEGTCVLWLIVDTNGKPKDVKVVRSLGMGLDEKAIDTVRSWRFTPARKQGKPVAVQINVEINFRLFSGSGEFQKLSKKADSGNAEAQFKISQLFLEGHDSGDDSCGLAYLEKAAKQGLPKAQFALGDFFSTRKNDLVSAYFWYGLAEKNGYKHNDDRMSELARRMTQDQLTYVRQRLEQSTTNENHVAGTSPQ